MKMDPAGTLKVGADSHHLGRTTTVFRIANMEGRSEEQAIRVRLGEIPEVESLSFDLARRRLTVVHALATPQSLLSVLAGIGMNVALDAASTPVGSGDAVDPARTSGGVGRGAPTTVVFTIPNMDCRNEEAAIRARLGALAEVEELNFDLQARRLSVLHTFPSATPILEQLHSIGMQARLDGGVSEVAPSNGESASGCCPSACSSVSREPPASGNTTRFFISNMDCPTEEALIRKRLVKVDGIDRLDFDLMNRRLDAQHRLGDPALVLEALREIGMKAT